MYILVSFFIVVATLSVIGKLYSIFKNKINFFLRGWDEGFSSLEIGLLWEVSNICHLEEPISIFYSMPSLVKCISHIKIESEKTGSPDAQKMQNIISKLYVFRNKIEKDTDKKRGLDSTKSLQNHQKLRIIFPGKGVFSSELINNGNVMAVRLPTQKGQITIEGKNWVGQSLSVYLWRTGDARYVFDTKVLEEGVFMGKPSLFLEHTSNLVRTQKRNALRAKCHIVASLYILNEKQIDYNEVIVKPGLKCLLEDISESGALIRIGGQGVPNVQLRLQFQLENKLIVMFGIVRTVEYNAELKQSRLHFECVHIENSMKNIVLSYVYNILPEKDKEIFDAIALTDDDEKEEEQKEPKNELNDLSQKLSEEIKDTDKIIEKDS